MPRTGETYKSREEVIERRLTADQRAAAITRLDGYIAACRKFEIRLPSSTVHRAYIEALEEVERGDDDHRMLSPESQHERRDYSVNYQYAWE